MGTTAAALQVKPPPFHRAPVAAGASLAWARGSGGRPGVPCGMPRRFVTVEDFVQREARNSLRYDWVTRHRRLRDDFPSPRAMEVLAEYLPSDLYLHGRAGPKVASGIIVLKDGSLEPPPPPTKRARFAQTMLDNFVRIAPAAAGSPVYN